MKFFALLAILLSIVAHPLQSQTNNAASSDRPLTAYRDKNRVLLVFAPSPQDAAYLEQMKLWQTEKAGFEDRQLVVLPIFAGGKKLSPEQQASLAPIMKKHGIDAGTFGVVLIGKDGHDAYHATKPVSAETLYGLIDAMPMRRVEMKHPQASPTPHRPDLDHDE